MMKRRSLIVIALLAGNFSLCAQSALQEFTAGHIFYVSLPEYMSKTTGLNSAATIQFKNTVKDVYGFVIEDNKEEMALAEIKYASINEFYEDFIKDFLKEEEKRKISKAVYETKGDINFAFCDASYYDKDAKGDIYYFVGIAETKASFYKMLCWCTIESRDKFVSDFQRIMYSIRD